MGGDQTAFDDFGPPGDRNYWKSHTLQELTDDALDVAIEYAKKMPTPFGEILLVHLGGAVSRVPSDATAYPHRDSEFLTPSTPAGRTCHGTRQGSPGPASTSRP